MSTLDLAYPIGKARLPERGDVRDRDQHVAQIGEAPAQLRAAVEGLDDRQLDTPYREHGWTVRQVVHHLADSQLNAYVRFRLALTENDPAVKTYEEALWAELPDARSGDVELSLTLFEAVTRRWLACIEALPTVSFERGFRHPDTGPMTLTQQLALYAWHGRHHIAQITRLATREGWR